MFDRAEYVVDMVRNFFRALDWPERAVEDLIHTIGNERLAVFRDPQRPAHGIKSCWHVKLRGSLLRAGEKLLKIF